MVISFKYPHLHSDKVSRLFNNKLSFQLEKPERCSFGERIKKADPQQGVGRQEDGPGSLLGELSGFPDSCHFSVADVSTSGI